MALATAVKDSRHSSQVITWSPVVDLTGATITGTIRAWGTDAAPRIIDGTLSVYGDAANGQVEWVYGVNDVGESGTFLVKLTSNFGAGDDEISMEELWVVRP